MTLDEIESEAQMLGAIEAQDPELLGEIQYAISDAVQTMWGHGSSEVFFDVESEADVFSDKIQPYFEGDVGLERALELLDIMELEPDLERHLQRLFPPTGVEPLSQILRDTVLSDTDPRVNRLPELFSLEWGDREYTSRGLEVDNIYYEDGIVLEEPLAWVPERVIESFLNEAVDYDWEYLGEGRWSTGWLKTDSVVNISIHSSRSAEEWARDRIREYYSDLIDADPEAMVSKFEEYLEKEHPVIYKNLRKAKLPMAVRQALAVALFEDMDDPAIGLELISQTLGLFGYEGTRGELLTVITRDDLRDMGITSGKWWDGAPWRLYNLPPNELAYEGTLMRHCVGRIDMGYQQAAESGQIQIWSLRSKFNIPVLTWQIDMPAWQQTESDPEANMVERGEAIRQIKGKLNRLPPKDQDERVVLLDLFDRFAVDPDAVADFDRRRSNPRTSFNLPYMP